MFRANAKKKTARNGHKKLHYNHQHGGSENGKARRRETPEKKNGKKWGTKTLKNTKILRLFSRSNWLVVCYISLLFVRVSKRSKEQTKKIECTRTFYKLAFLVCFGTSANKLIYLIVFCAIQHQSYGFKLVWIII